MRTTPVALALVGLLGLSACGGAGRPGAGDVLTSLNSRGVACAVQDAGLALPDGSRTERSCLTPDGREIGISTYDSDDEQQAFLERTGLSSSVFTTVVYDYGYLMFVPERALGARVTDVMDAQSVATGSAGCPTARGGACGPSSLGGS